MAYDVAFLGMAIDKLGNVDPKYSKYLDDWVNYFVHSDGSVTDYRMEEYNLDRIFPGRDVITVYKRNPDQKYKIAIDNFIEQLKSHPRTNSGGYWHKKIYPWQMWLDGIFMDQLLWLNTPGNLIHMNGSMFATARQNDL